MDVETAIRTRRTHKAFAPEPLAREEVDELLDLARWAPNHHLTAPWRFRVVGPRALARLKRAAGPEGSAKLDRAPTLIVASAALSGDPVQDEEDLHATAVASYIVLLAAHARGPRGLLAHPGLLREPAGGWPVGLPDEESFVGLLHLGRPRQEQIAPERPGPRADRRPTSTDAPPARRQSRRSPVEHFEVVVIGGGVTGAGVALDAASRGYSVALLERGDYALGTSSRSSKMVHGGLRYLQNLDLGLVREALLERQLMVQLAPHLVYPTPFVVPSFADERRDRKLGIGLNMYDVMATTRVGRSRREMRSSKDEDDDFYWSPDRHRTIDREELLELVPSLEPRDPNDAYLFYDCQTDDVRLVLTILGEAERYGAVMLNGAEVTEVLSEGGRAAGVAVIEAESGERFEVGAENVVNATGVFADADPARGGRRRGGRAADQAQPGDACPDRPR